MHRGLHFAQRLVRHSSARSRSVTDVRQNVVERCRDGFALDTAEASMSVGVGLQSLAYHGKNFRQPELGGVDEVSEPLIDHHKTSLTACDEDALPDGPGAEIPVQSG